MGSRLFVVATFLGLTAAAPASPQDQIGPPPLRLPAGVHARVWTRTLPTAKIEGTLLGADSTAVWLVPKGGHPLAPGEMRVPASDVTRLELALEKKRHFWQGALIGAAVGVLMGLTDDVDPVVCEFNENVLCSRGEAVATYGVGGAVSGAIIGALVRTDRWTPVALDALRPPPARVSGAKPQLRTVPGGGVSLGLAVGF